MFVKYLFEIGNEYHSEHFVVYFQNCGKSVYSENGLINAVKRDLACEK
jgi:hypothetical protein